MEIISMFLFRKIIRTIQCADMKIKINIFDFSNNEKENH